MTSPPRTVSVVTPSYNQGRFLPETIESVLSQEGNFFLDYLVIDGGSTDDSVAVIRRYDSLLAGGKWPVPSLDVAYTSDRHAPSSDCRARSHATPSRRDSGWRRGRSSPG